MLLRNICLSAKSGQLIAIIGPSGSGKTTLLRLIANLLQPTTGTIHLLKNDLSLPLVSHVSFLGPDDALFPWKTVAENVHLPLELQRKKNHDLVAQVIESMGLSPYINTRVEDLSSGQKKLTSISRTLLEDRPILLLDEPFSSVDIVLREHIYKVLRTITLERKKILFFVTHDFRDALSLADTMFLLKQGQLQQTWEGPFHKQVNQTFPILKEIHDAFSS